MRRAEPARSELLALPAALALGVLLIVTPGSGCDRAPSDPSGEVEVPARPERGADVALFVVGQVVTGPGPAAERPVESLDDMAVSRAFRVALLAEDVFFEEPAPGPMLDFDLAWSMGEGAAEPPPRVAPEGTGGAAADPPGRYLVLVLQASARGTEGPRYELEVQGIYREPVASDEAVADAAARLLRGGLTDLAQGLRDEARPRTMGDEALLEALAESAAWYSTPPRDAADALARESGDRWDALLPMLREAMRRRLAGAAPSLRAHLAADDLDVLLVAIAGLGQLRDAEALNPLTELIGRRHPELTAQVLPVIARIGTAEARLYLQTVADAHDDPGVRRLARELLEAP